MNILKTIILSGSLLIGMNSAAQDRIFKKTGEVMTVNIIRINNNFIIYKLINQPQSPEFMLPRRFVTRLVYRNGREIILYREPAGKATY